MLVLLVGVAVGVELLRRMTAAAEVESEAPDVANAPPGVRGTDDDATH
jgi:hypothetical protein